jgi:hypothetical protein
MRAFLIILLSIMLAPNTQGETGIITIDAADYWAETGVQVQENRALDRNKEERESDPCRQRLCVFRAGSSVKVTILNRFW